MSIISIQFVLLVAVLVLLYFTLPQKCRWVLLLLASALFYISGSIKGCLYIVVTIVSQYLIALVLDSKNRKMAKELSDLETNGSDKTEIKRILFIKKMVYNPFSCHKPWTPVLS